MCVEATVLDSKAPEGTEPFTVVLARGSELKCSESSLDHGLQKLLQKLMIHFTHYGSLTIDLTDITKVTATFIATGEARDMLIERLSELEACEPAGEAAPPAAA